VVRISAKNPLRIARERLVISRFELARKAGVSMLTLARIEEGKPCRIDTKRRIAETLGFNPWREGEKPSSPER
jgi:predicted transcriptional regulator